MAIDTIVIGSGIGGLTAAVTLARAGQQVLVLEQHYLPGGWTHSFTLEGHSFSPGVHYLGELGEGRHFRRLFEGLELEGLGFWELDPDGFDHILIGDERLDVPKGRQAWQRRLCERFPQQAKAIRRYFDVVVSIEQQLRRVDEYLSFPRVLALPFLAPQLTRWGFRTLADVFDHAGITDPLLRGALSARCGNHGLAPSRVSFPMHAAMIAHYFGGAYYPQGGARRITSAFVRALRRHGGEIRLRTRVHQILVEGGRAVGVELEGGERIRCDHVVSNADAVTTYTKLLPPGAAPKVEKKARNMEPSVSCLSLFAAVDDDLVARGYDGGNYWWYREPDVDGIYRRTEKAQPGDPLDTLFLSVSSLKDPGRGNGTQHTLEMFTFVPFAPFERFLSLECGDRGADYEALKTRMTDAMLDAAEHIMPGLREHLVFRELGTPATNVHYCEAYRGSCYGTAKTPWQVGPFALGMTSPIEGLSLCGASTLSHGLAGASTSGLLVAGRLLGWSSQEEGFAPETGAVEVRPASPPRHRAPWEPPTAA